MNRFEDAALRRVNLNDHLSDIYRIKARYTVMVISRHYVEKVRTVGYLPLDGREPEDVAALIAEKLRTA